MNPMIQMIGIALIITLFNNCGPSFQGNESASLNPTVNVSLLKRGISPYIGNYLMISYRHLIEEGNQRRSIENLDLIADEFGRITLRVDGNGCVGSKRIDEAAYNNLIDSYLAAQFVSQPLLTLEDEEETDETAIEYRSLTFFESLSESRVREDVVYFEEKYPQLATEDGMIFLEQIQLLRQSVCSTLPED